MNRRHATTAMAGFLVVTASWCAAVAQPAIDSVMEDDPALAAPPSKIIYTKGLKPLWLKALAGPEADLQREVAEMIARAHHLGFPGMKETAGPLIKVLSTEKQRPAVRLAIARTLVVLDARTAATPLFELLDEEGLGFAQVVEPALAEWDYKPIRERWVARVSDIKSRSGLQQLAIRGLGKVRETKAVAPLWKLAENRSVWASLRLDAAAALGRIQVSGLASRANTLAADKTPRAIVDRLVAGKLLSHHSDESSRNLLLELAVDHQPTVAAVALRRLLEIDSLLVIPITAELLENPDANVRMLSARALATHPVSLSVEQLGPVLNDPHPDVRRFVCRTLFTFGSQPEVQPIVHEAATQVLGQDEWRGQEQAALLLGALDHKPSASRLVTLLDAPRHESRIAAAWALRKLAVASTLPAMVARATRIADKRKQEFDGQNDEQFVQLAQAFGQRKYQPATDVLWRPIPKDSPFFVRERVAAIWALGHIDVGDRRSELVELLKGRLSDVNPFFPEDDYVRAMSAISMGRMKATAAVDVLRRFYGEEADSSPVGMACRWSIERITGEKLPGPKPGMIHIGGWRLAPLSSSTSE